MFGMAKSENDVTIDKITIIPKKEIDEAYRNLLNKMLEENQYFGTFQDIDWLNNRIVSGTIRLELNITDLKHLI